MSSVVTSTNTQQTASSQPQSREHQHRGSRGGKAQGNKGRGRGGRGGREINNGRETKVMKNQDSGAKESREKTDLVEDTTRVVAAAADDVDSESDVCWICAEPVIYYSLSACNHRTCHVCALRLRALYKKDVCTFCKEPQQDVIFTTSADKPFAEYADELSSSIDGSSPKFYDPKLRVAFETQEMMTESLILLRFNCPDNECDYIAKGWGDLKMHVRASHGRLMCDLCIRSKKVFAHEHVLYTYQQLRVHLPSMDYNGRQRAGKKSNATLNPPEGGIHPLCEFCRECFFSEDELYAHMRERHEECFVCKREGVRDNYFATYPDLESHFSTAHYACTHPECLQRKFVVFGSALDLQAHMVDEHGASRKVVGIEFASGAGGGRDIGSRNNRDPPPRQQPPPLPPPAPSQNQSRRRQAFGGALTSGDATPTTSSPAPVNIGPGLGISRRSSPTANADREDTFVDPAVADRHSAFLTLLSNLAPNPSSALTAVKAAARGYRAGESTARDLIGIVWNVLDVSQNKGSGKSGTEGLEPTARVINSFVDLLEEDEDRDGIEEKDKKSLELLREWKGFEIEQRRQFPDLIASTTASSSTGGYAAITSGRVLNAKHSTHTSSNRGGSTTRRVWDRVAQAANSSSGARLPNAAGPSGSLVPGSLAAVNAKTVDKFPPLGGGGVGSSKAPTGSRKTPWAGSGSTSSGAVNPSATSAFPGLSSSASSSSPAPLRPFSVPASSITSKTRTNGTPPPKLSTTAFPGLPTSENKREKVQVKGNVSLRNILGSTKEVPTSKWGASGGNGLNGTGALPAPGSGSATPVTTPGPNEVEELVEPTEVEVGEGLSATGKKSQVHNKGKGKGKQKQMLFTLGSFPT
ncbi:c2h2 finger domain-containing protein [Lentinula edodes]|uniref:RING-type E3 ubiquitin transferase n=1 Tax=Lentinula edodes TaxID=5353 RepID=A0A1Q3EHW9_LENED|nr:c2h2 finger domain-containing protein [Lentinula edodes]